MYKINVFAQCLNGDMHYKTRICTGRTTIKEIMRDCNLSTFRAYVYIDGKHIPESEYTKPVSVFKQDGTMFMSVRYGEAPEEPKKGK